MAKKLTILIIPFDAFGHVYSCVGVGQQLLQEGHRVVFVIENSWQGKLLKYGFEEQIYNVYTEEENKEASEHWIKFFKETGFITNKSPLEKVISFKIEEIFDKIKKSEPFIDKILNEIKPDVTITDTFMAVPSIVQQKIWINLNPFCPNLILSHENSPPPMSGLPSNDKSHWEEFRNEWEKVFLQRSKQIMMEWFNSKGVDLPLKEKHWSQVSPNLNIYAYPKELDFIDLRPLPDNWIRFDSFIRNEGQTFEIPEKLKNKPGKLIYFSLGSLGSGDVNLMKKLTAFLSESPHRFIVSKGMLGDQYELPDNCWGENHVSQTKILEIVDLAIIHGGNNSVCETFYFGKPMIVMPLFSDQYDNAQRVDEKGFGIRIDPYKCSKEELLNAIEKLLNNEELKRKLKEISKRIDNDIKSNKLAKIIENLVENVN